MSQEKIQQGDIVVVVMPAKLYYKDAKGIQFIRGVFNTEYNGKYVIEVHLKDGSTSVQEFSIVDVISLQDLPKMVVNLTRGFTGLETPIDASESN